MTLVGALGSDGRARVDGAGRVTPVDERWALDWWVGADDRWHVPAREAAVRQTLVPGAPVTETMLRIPSGDAVQRVYGVGGPAGLVVVEVENQSPAPFVVGFALAGRDGAAVARVALVERVVELDGRPAVVVPFAPSRWHVARTGEASALEVVTTGGASLGPFPEVNERAGVEVALLYPLAHRTRMRVAVALGSTYPSGVDLAALPGPEDVARGWRTVIGRGMRVVLPDPKLAEAVDHARAEVLLDADRGPAAVAALEDWGYDEEAEYAWHGLRLRDRRAARRRPAPAREPWPEDAAGLLLAVRSVLAHEVEERTVDLLGVVPKGWRGQPIEVHDAPTRLGRISYALRWHGARPALLWEVTDPAPGLVLRTPGLDPDWSTTDAAGEALLAPPISRPTPS